MSTMIERVARAMIANDSGPEGSKLFEIHLDEFGEGYRSSARAAMEAMIEPTDGMHEAAEEISVYYDDFSCGDGNITLGLSGYREKFNQVWQKLITAALEETQ